MLCPNHICVYTQDHFDNTALLAYAVANGREDELIESGCAEIRKLHGLGQTQVGLWKLPSTSLFEDFNADLAKRLEHDYVQGTVIDVTRNDIEVEAEDVNNDDDNEEGYTLTLSDGTEITCSAVVLALGPVGKLVVPPKMCNVPKEKLIPWNYMKENLKPKHEVVLVVGGGLTAVQAAQHCLREGKRVILCSRRPLVERHFDINECWFDKRSANLHIADFYHLPEEERLEALRGVRGGGSVPPLYMKDIRKWEKKGQLTLVNTVEPRFVSSTDTGKVLISLDQIGAKEELGVEVQVDCVILATGIKPDCLENHLVRKIHENFPCDIVGGFPNVSVDLEWSKNLFVVGALASLNVGPGKHCCCLCVFMSLEQLSLNLKSMSFNVFFYSDGGNIMGARRAASIVANSLECKSWLRLEERGALSNPFEAFWDESSSSEEDSDCD